MNLTKLFLLFREFETECHTRNIEPTFELFELWAETTHTIFVASSNSLFEELVEA
jgi:hypothetical protein